jgi:sugar fermentation stimulation protein A
MKFESPLVRGILVRRYKRFLADVDLPGHGMVTVHCANSGTMLGVSAPGSVVWVMPARNPKAALRWSWQMIEVDGGLVGIDTGRPNPIAAEAIAAGLIPELNDYTGLRREVRYGVNSRIDLLLEAPGRAPCYVEVKNVHLRRNGRAEFPDSVTARGTKHLGELAVMAEAGARSVMLYVVQRGDCDSFALAADIDPTYAAALADARRRGVEAYVWACRLDLHGIALDRPLALEL